MKQAYITIIGSRETPLEICAKLSEISLFFCKKGYIMRSGGASGADESGAKGIEKYIKEKKRVAEIIIPWNNFSNLWHDGINYFTFTNLDKKIQEKALKIAEKIHPAWSACSNGARILHARNSCQILGLDLKTPSDLVVAWTFEGEEKGGTRTALVLAKEKKIPIFNLGAAAGLEDLRKYTKELFDKQ